MIGSRKLGAGMDEVAVVALDQHPALGPELEVLPLVKHGLDPAEEPGVQVDLVTVRRQLWSHFLLDFLEGGVRVRGGDGEEHLGGPGQQGASAFHGHEGVLEGRCGRVVGDLPDLGKVRLHACFDRRQVVAILDPVELGGVVGEGTGLYERCSGWSARSDKGAGAEHPGRVDEEGTVDPRHGVVLRGMGVGRHAAQPKYGQTPILPLLGTGYL